VRDAIFMGIATLIGFLALGFVVSNMPPTDYDLAGDQFGGVELKSAVFFTSVGLFPVYSSLCAFLLVVGIAYRKWLDPVLISVVTLIVMWLVSDIFKLVFHRARPEHWFVVHETSFGYPSGHAVLAITFYGFWAYLAVRSSLPLGVRATIVTAAILWIFAIGWSRLALGAHYPSDVLGGYLLGLSALGFEIAIFLAVTKRDRERELGLR
jgi:undecaprenyl-diphosphatase